MPFWRALTRNLLLSLAFLAGSAFSQSDPATVTFEEVVQVGTAEFEVGGLFDDDEIEVIEVSVEQATLEELEEVLVGDYDFDGTKNLLDSCPMNPFCAGPEDLLDQDQDGFPAWHDGDDQDPSVSATGDAAIDEAPVADEMTPYLARFEGPEDMVYEILLENQAKQLYPMEDLLGLGEASGLDPEIVEGWREEFLESEPSCRECIRDAVRRCREACPKGKRKGKKGYRCRCRCFKKESRDCRKACKKKKKKWAKKRKKKPKKKGHPHSPSPGRPKSKPKPGLLVRSLFRLSNWVRGWWSR